MISPRSFLIFVWKALLSKPMQKIILTLLAFLAKSIILFHKPKIIWITWTVWKTTVTSHIHAFLAQTLPDKKIGYSKYHYNGEYGMPLTIIWAKTGWKNPFLWVWVFMVGFSRFFRPYYDILVLEYGIDHPGEMDFLLSIAVPDIAVLTEIAPNHLEQFVTFEAYKREKFKLVNAVSELIIHDSLKSAIDREWFYYGSGAMSDIDISHVTIDTQWTHARVHMRHSDHEISVRDFGIFHIVNLLPLYALAEIYQIDVEKVAHYARGVHGEPGRSNILNGKNWSLIIDGSYNGWYLALHAGIESIRTFSISHKIYFIIGDMRELGNETELIHKKLAHDIVDMYWHQDADIEIILVWPYMRQYIFPILEPIFDTQSHLSSRKVGHILLQKLTENQEKPSMIYVKWSQNTIFLEETVRLILRDNKDIAKLCRQTLEWQKKKDVFFQTMD